MALSTPRSLRRRVTAVVWVLGMALALVAIARRPSTQIRALAWGAPAILAAPEDGTLLTFEVSLDQEVSVGDALARFDPTRLTARSQVLEAELEALSEKEDSARQGRSRLFERDREEAGLERAELTARVAEGEAQLRAIQERLAIEEQLVAEGLAPTEKAGEVRREIEVAQTRLDADRSRLSLAERGARRAGNRAAAAPGPNQWQLVAAERRLAEVEARLDRLVLQSPTHGRVTEIYRAPGEYVEMGKPVLRISPATTEEVHAWLDARAAPGIQPGAEAEIRRASGERLVGTVLSVGAERLALPEELWARPGAPEWGYRIRIQTSSDVLGPGEPVQVSLESGGS